MSHQVLARKYRPRSFAEMVGQEHVLRALVNGLEQGRLHHAYLFTGTRGVGKTTVARVLARCLNCETGVTSTPCGTCPACQEIDQGRFVDLIEVDAASRTRVEDTRELLENVQYVPTRGRYKIYLVDEVHMLSGHSFNALLKTLEEPPPHVVFLLATTDPQRLPVTVLSRCLQFNLKRLPVELIAGYLARVLGEEGIESEENALRRLSLAAEGSMRDALSLTDQAIAFGDGTIRDAEVQAMLGTIGNDHVLAVLDALAAGDGEAVMAVVAELAERTPDFTDVLSTLLSTLHDLAVRQMVPAAADSGHPDARRLDALCERLSPEDVQLFYQIALTGRRDLPLSPDPRLGLEMVLLRMLAFRPVPSAGDGGRAAPAPAPAQGRSPDDATARAVAPAAGESRPPEPPAASSGAETSEGSAASRVPAELAAGTAPVEGGATVPPWPELLLQLGLSGMSQALAMQCSWGGYQDGTVSLLLDSGHGHLRSEPLEKRITEALERWFGKPVRLRIEVVDAVGEEATPASLAEQERIQRQTAAEQSISSDPNISALREMFDAEVIPDSVQPIR